MEFAVNVCHVVLIVRKSVLSVSDTHFLHAQIWIWKLHGLWSALSTADDL